MADSQRKSASQNPWRWILLPPINPPANINLTRQVVVVAVDIHHSSADHYALSLSLINVTYIESMLAMLERNRPPGCVVEVGTYKGGTAYFLDRWARENGREMFVYDTFTGIPYAQDGDSHVVGDFGDSNQEAVQNLIPHATVVKGIFPDSAVSMPPIAFAHLDVDQYKSYIDTCTYLNDKMSPGGIMWFDDPGCLPAALRAVTELYGDRLRIDEASSKYYVMFQ